MNLRSFDCIAARDWPAFRALTSADFTFHDRRKRSLVSGDVELFIKNLEVVASWTISRRTIESIATIGDRIALDRIAFVGDHDGSAFEGEFLRLTEVDANGRLRAVIHFDLDDRSAAFIEAQTRFAAGEAATIGGQVPILAFHRGFGRAFAQNDWTDVQQSLADDLVFRDRRVLGLGILARDEWVASLKAQHTLAPDMRGQPFRILAWNRHGRVDVQRIFGTMPDGGGAFENVFVRVIVTEGDRIRHYETFDVGDVDQALARFEELQPDPTRIPPNAASRVRDRTGEAFVARDWDAFRALASDDFVFEDRQRRALLKGDVELWIASMRQLAFGGGRRESERIATVGERIVLDRLAWAGALDDVRWEWEQLRLTEVDANGRLRASINFDMDDRSAAFDEAQIRFANGEAAGCGAQTLIQAFGNALAGHDWDDLRTFFADGLVFRDRRKLSFGDIPCDKLIESLHVLTDLAPDVGGEMLHLLAWNNYGRVAVVRQFGATRDGGSFENVFVPLLVVRGDHIVAYEVFDVGNIDRALARFAELCASLDVNE